MSRLKWAGLAVVAGLAAIGAATTADQESQVDEVSACTRDAGLRVKRDDFVVESARRRTSIPGIEVARPSPVAPVADVYFYPDDFEAEKERPGWEEADAHVEQLENVLVVKVEEAPESIGSVRTCIRRTLAAAE